MNFIHNLNFKFQINNLKIKVQDFKIEVMVKQYQQLEKVYLHNNQKMLSVKFNHFKE